MSTPNPCGRGAEELIVLSALLPDPVRAEAARLRCRAEFVRRAGCAERSDAIASAFARTLVPLLLGTMSALYAAALLVATARVEGWLRHS